MPLTVSTMVVMTKNPLCETKLGDDHFSTFAPRFPCSKSKTPRPTNNDNSYSHENVFRHLHWISAANKLILRQNDSEGCTVCFRISFDSSMPVLRFLALKSGLRCNSTQSLRLEIVRPCHRLSFRANVAPRKLLTAVFHQKHWSSTSTPPAVPPVDQEEKRVKYNNWIDRLPTKIAPYAFLTRVDKPIGTWLLYWPCAWSISMASFHSGSSLVDTGYMLALFGVGAITMRGAGCTINDLWDRDIDNKVERTKTRPLAAGTITPRAAILFLGAQLSVGLGVLTQLNMYSILLGASSLSLVVTYPLMKRITYWPQTVLGLAFNWGALLGWSAMTGSLDLSVAGPLYAGGVAWTLVYDTIYAHQDKKDDVMVGVKSTALRFGDRTSLWLTGFSTMFVSMTALAGYMNGQGLPFYLISVLGTSAHLAWQLKTVDYNNPGDCWAKFKSNALAGGILWSGIAADAILSSAAVAA